MPKAAHNASQAEPNWSMLSLTAAVATANSTGCRSLLNRRTLSHTPVRSAGVDAPPPGNARDTPRSRACRTCGAAPDANPCRPQSPVAYPVSTYGASCTMAVLRCDKTSHHSQSDVTSKRVTMVMNSSARNVFWRSLKIKRAVWGLADPASDAACARNPSRGSAENTFCHPAVIVTVTSQTSGAAVTHANRPRPILIRIVVPTHNATAASSWFEIPNSGHSELIPPSGSTTP